MKTFFLTLAIIFICLLQGLMSSKVKSESEMTSSESSQWGYRGCGYSGYYPCHRGWYNRYGARYWGYPYGFGYNGCYRNCYRRGICC